MSLWHDDGGHRVRRSPNLFAPIARRHAVYSALVAELGLTQRHRDHLVGPRGLPTTALAGFASSPGLGLSDALERQRLARRVVERSCQSVAGIAGFYRDGNAWALVPLDRGFLVPVPDHLGRLAAMQLRRDDAGPDGQRYGMLSSARWQAGASSGVPVAVWRPELNPDGCLVVEAYLKGLIAAEHLPVCVLGIAGVSNWRPALKVLASAPAGYTVTIAHDVPDLTTVPEVWQAREALATALVARGFTVSVATWDGRRAKGIDDALLAGVAVGVEPWRPTLAPVVAPRSTALPAPERPAAVPLMAVVR